MDRAYINYEKFEEFMRRNVNDVTKMKKNLTETPFDFMKMTTEGKLLYSVREKQGILQEP